MKTAKLIAIILFVFPFRLFSESKDSSAKSFYFDAKRHIENMLAEKQDASYERAIFEIENAWYENKLDNSAFTAAINTHVGNIKSIFTNYDKNKTFSSDLLKTAEQKKLAYEKALMNYAIFTYMTDTSFWAKNGQFKFLIRQQPFSYLHSDPLGTIDWSHTQVVSLLTSGQGNCFSLASLYKIFADRLGSDATLCTAPEHIYIRHADDKGIFYNVELAGRVFPGTGTIETLTYTSNEATKNNIALRGLTTKQTIALCLVYLAKGYEYKFKISDDDFMWSCANTALIYDDHNLNALLLKAQILESRIVKTSKPIKQLQASVDFKEYEKFIAHVCSLGYREMPFEMKNIIIKGWMKDTVIQLSMKDQKPNRNVSPTLSPTRYASLSWGLFDEEIQTKRVERFGNTAFDTKTKKIIGFLQSDVLFNRYNFDPVAFALNVDPLAHKFPGQSPYSAFDNSPIAKNDPDGRNAVLVIWATHNGEIGHAAIAISNYKEVKTKVMENGKPMEKTSYVPDGTYTYRDLWPGGGGAGKKNFSENVPGIYNKTTTTLYRLINTDVSGSEGRATDGVIQLKTTYASDQITNEALEAFQLFNPKYNGLNTNCSDFAAEGVRWSANGQINPSETLSGDVKATTPNQLYKTTKALPNATILKDAGNTVNKGFIESVTNGGAKQKIGEKKVD